MPDPSLHILLVDSHAELREALARCLRQQGWLVSTAGNGDCACALARANSLELVVLEMRLPDEDGLSLCRFFAGKLGLPVIFLSAAADRGSRIRGLGAGADDYLSKPFDPGELVARIQAVLRRCRRAPALEAPLAASAGRRYVFDRWALDIGQRALFSQEGAAVPLSSSEFRLLQALVENPGKVLSRDRLLDLTCGEETLSFDRSIDNQVSRLRKKLEADPRHPCLLKTVWGEGYLLAAEVRLI